jgi:hypothetical protein
MFRSGDKSMDPVVGSGVFLMLEFFKFASLRDRDPVKGR